MAGNRLFFPVQAVIFYSGKEWDGMEESAMASGSYTDIDFDERYTAHGVQDVGMTSNFAINPVFEVGQSNIYENTEGMPTTNVGRHMHCFRWLERSLTNPKDRQRGHNLSLE